MSIELMTLVWKIPMRPYEKLILLALADYANPNGDHVFPSVQSMADKTTCSARKIQTTMRRLQTQGLLELVAEASQHSPRRYRLNVAALQDLAAARGARRAPLNATSGGARHDVRGCTPRRPGVHATTFTGARRAPNPSLTTKDPSGEPSPRTPPPAAGGEQARSPEFTRFWSLYPRRMGEVAAWRVWQRLGCEIRAEEIFRGLARQRAYLGRETGRWAPMPTKWLRDGRWRDEVPAMAEGFLTPATAGNADVARRFAERSPGP